MALSRTLGALILAAAAGTAQAATLEVGAQKTYKNPSDAAAAAKPGDHIVIQPGEYFDCATLKSNKLVFEGATTDAATVVMTDKVCGGKGLLITTGNDITIRNLTLTRARVPDGNGAGIRNEAANLTIENVRFVNNQDGILSTPSDAGTLMIRNSLFDKNGSCINNGGCAHGIYVNTGTLLHIENTTFSGTKQGHHVKSRAARTEIVGCTVTDGEDGTASYLIEQPNGGSLVVRDSKLEKGAEAENHTAAIMIGSEGVTQPTREITIENNTFRNDGGFTTYFVDNLTATEAVLRGNHLSGNVKPLNGDGKVTPGS